MLIIKNTSHIKIAEFSGGIGILLWRGLGTSRRTLFMGELSPEKTDHGGQCSTKGNCWHEQVFFQIKAC